MSSSSGASAAEAAFSCDVRPCVTEPEYAQPVMAKQRSSMTSLQHLRARRKAEFALRVSFGERVRGSLYVLKGRHACTETNVVRVSRAAECKRAQLLACRACSRQRAHASCHTARPPAGRSTSAQSARKEVQKYESPRAYAHQCKCHRACTGLHAHAQNFVRKQRLKCVVSPLASRLASSSSRRKCMRRRETRAEGAAQLVG
eukprot:6203598-Pleurochrysis_carterae.AAC.1